MPDHVHALLVAHHGHRRWDVVGAIKAQVSRLSSTRGLWQRSFHDHVVRDEADLTRLHEYISTNPLRWELSRRDA
jgi:REP element-mobilizing transposase RayT